MSEYYLMKKEAISLVAGPQQFSDQQHVQILLTAKFR